MSENQTMTQYQLAEKSNFRTCWVRIFGLLTLVFATAWSGSVTIAANTIKETAAGSDTPACEYADYPATDILIQLEYYSQHGVNSNSSGKLLIDSLIKFQKQLVTGASPLPSCDSREPMAVLKRLKEMFAEIGKAEYIKRGLYSYRLSGAPEENAEMIAQLLPKQAEFINQLYARPEVGVLLTAARKHKDLGRYDEFQGRMIDAMRYDHAVHTAIPEELVSRLAVIQSQGRGFHATWKTANNKEDALEWLEAVFEVQREVGRAMAEALDLETPYDGALAMFQPGYDSKSLNRFFGELIPEVKQVAEQAIRQQTGRAKPKLPPGPYDLKQQEKLNEITAGIFQVDENRYHLSFSNLHSLEGGLPGDVRLVVNLSKSRLGDFVKSNRSTMHEIGHGLYIDAIPEGIQFSPLGKLMGTGVEEGMAFFVEKMVTRSRPYADFIAPQATQIFQKQVSAADYFQSRTWVERSLIRIAADEVTYPLHPYIRMQIERDLINGVMEIDDLECRWSQLYQEHLGVKPDTPGRGFLQDAQWFAGKVGMFPFYTLGDAIAVQIWQAMENDLGNLDRDIRNGDLSRVREWLDTEVFSKGRYIDVDEFMIDLTGEPLSAKFLIAHLRSRYLNEQP
ncbi:MAG: hypothetical protein P8I27_10535 [Pirellulaceae bacterium]|nr:hypothetical protein [Pirellulaceae bacterium]